jgi:hypothetical protein
MKTNGPEQQNQMAEKYTKKCSISLATLRFHLTPDRMATIKNTNTKCWQGCGEKEPSYTVGGNVS